MKEKDTEDVVKKWLQGDTDRDGGRNAREER
jgi:hypothetical protein